MSLINRMNEFTNSLDVKKASSDNQNAISELEIIWNDLSDQPARLKDSLSLRKSLQRKLKKFPLSDIEESTLSGARAILDEVLEIWLSDDFKVRENEKFVNFVDLVNKLLESHETTNAYEYKNWISDRLDELRVGDAELESQRKIPDARENADVYSRAYDVLLSLKKQPPSIEDIDTLLSQVSIATESLGKMKFDIPDYVQAFLVAVEHGAPLEMLTDDVMKWLQENSQSEKYVIKSKFGRY